MKSSLLFIAFLASCIVLMAGDTNDAPIFTVPFSVHGQKYALEFFNKDLLNGPDWEMGTTEPPISPNEAYRRARHALDVMFPAMRDITCNEIFLQRRFGSDGQHHVYYDIGFHSPDIDFQNMGSIQGTCRAAFMVMMDGKVISPRRIDEK
jgi:hypothetical protein